MHTTYLSTPSPFISLSYKYTHTRYKQIIRIFALLFSYTFCTCQMYVLFSYLIVYMYICAPGWVCPTLDFPGKYFTEDPNPMKSTSYVQAFRMRTVIVSMTTSLAMYSVHCNYTCTRSYDAKGKRYMFCMYLYVLFVYVCLVCLLTLCAHACTYVLPDGFVPPQVNI